MKKNPRVGFFVNRPSNLSAGHCVPLYDIYSLCWTLCTLYDIYCLKRATCSRTLFHLYIAPRSLRDRLMIFFASHQRKIFSCDRRSNYPPFHRLQATRPRESLVGICATRQWFAGVRIVRTRWARCLRSECMPERGRPRMALSILETSVFRLNWNPSSRPGVVGLRVIRGSWSSRPTRRLISKVRPIWLLSMQWMLGFLDRISLRSVFDLYLWWKSGRASDWLSLKGVCSIYEDCVFEHLTLHNSTSRFR